MKTKLLNYKVLLFLSLCLFLNCNRYGQEPLENQTKVDTLYWGPAYWETVSQEEECFDSWRDVPGFLYDEPIIKPDSVMECRFTKSELKEIPMVVYTNNLLKHSSPYKTIAKLELNVVDVLIGGTGSNRTFYESHEILWVRDSNCVIDTNANTIRITFDISKKIFYDEDMKFAISFLDSNGKVLFASNETWRNAPLVSSYQSEYGNIIGRCRLLSWNFKKANHSEIKIMTDWDSDLDKDTLVNDYSINLVKNTLHSPLFDHVASVRLDILPPTDKYDRILNEIEIIQNKIKRMYNEMNNYRKSDKVDCDFVRDFLLAPNCLNDIFLCPGDIEACINYYFAGGLNNDLAYFCYRTICWIYENELVTYIFNRTGGDSLGLSSKQGYTSALSKLLNDFVFDNNRLLINNRILSKAFPYERSIDFRWKCDNDIVYRKQYEYPSVTQSFIIDTLLPITQIIPSHKQCRRFIELLCSWAELMPAAIEVLSHMAGDSNDTVAKLYLGQVLEQNDFLEFLHSSEYSEFFNGFNFYCGFNSFCRTPLHWYLKAALNGSTEAERNVHRLLDSKIQEYDYYGNEYHKYENDLDDELMLLLEENYNGIVRQYSYKKKKKMLYDLINEVKQNRAKARQK